MQIYSAMQHTMQCICLIKSAHNVMYGSAGVHVSLKDV